MAKEKKSLLEEAIAEAKQVREAAVKNAYKALEESLTPSIKAMLEQKLEEEEIEDAENAEETLEETANSGFTEVKVKAPKKEVNEAEETEEEPDGDENGGEAEGNHEEPDGDEAEEEPDGDENGGEAEGNHEEPDGDEPASEGDVGDDTPLEDLTLGDLRGLISDLVQQISSVPAPEGNEGVDMETADVQGQGEEEVPFEDGEEQPNTEVSPEGEETVDSDEEIDINELLKELEEEENGKVVSNSQDKEINRLKKELKECKDTISNLTGTLSDVNLLNAKLMYVSRLLGTKNLTESQKVRTIKALDEAKTPKEVKVIYNTLNESLGFVEEKKVSRNRSLASKSAGRSTMISENKNIVSVDPVVRRFQQLAGIID